MKLFISIVVLCILPAILCDPPTTVRPRGGKRRTTARSTTASNNADGGNPLRLPEILLTVFDCLSGEDLSNARDVCRDWRAIIDANTLPERVQRLSLTRIPKNSPLTWQNFVSIYNAVAPQRNFWEIKYERESPTPRQQLVGGNDLHSVRWEIIPVNQITEIPNGSPKPNNYVKRSFVSVFQDNDQILNLVPLGLPGVYMDMIQPKIQIREWAEHRAAISRRRDSTELQVKISLLNNRDKKLHTYELKFKNNPSYAGKWEEKILTLENYGEGVRKIRIERDFRTMKTGSDIFILKPEARGKGARRSTGRHSRK